MPKIFLIKTRLEEQQQKLLEQQKYSRELSKEQFTSHNNNEPLSLIIPKFSGNKSEVIAFY